MAIPDYQTIMLPLLELLSDKKEYLFRDVVTVLGNKFKLSEEELNELLPSGQSFLFSNRVGWARTYLKKAGLIDAPKRGLLVITKRGIEVLKKKPKRIDNILLKQFPEFLEFQNVKKESAELLQQLENTSQTGKETPEETIDSAYQNIRQSLAQELIDTVRRLSPAFFERVVVELLVRMGYGGSIKDAGKAIGKTGDEGIDGTIKEDKLGLE